MKERTLLKCALISSILGIILLFYLSENIDLPKASIIDIKVMDEGKVKFKGEIVDVREYDDLVIYTLINTDTISGVVYGEHLTFNIGDKVRVIAEIDEYKENKQLKIEKMELNN